MRTICIVLIGTWFKNLVRVGAPWGAEAELNLLAEAGAELASIGCNNACLYHFLVSDGCKPLRTRALWSAFQSGDFPSWCLQARKCWRRTTIFSAWFTETVLTRSFPIGDWSWQWTGRMSCQRTSCFEPTVDPFSAAELIDRLISVNLTNLNLRSNETEETSNSILRASSKRTRLNPTCCGILPGDQVLLFMFEKLFRFYNCSFYFSKSVGNIDWLPSWF